MTRRLERLASLARRELSDILMKDINDPRIGFVTITAVEFTGDLSRMTVYVSVLGNDAAKKRSMEGLDAARGYIRRDIGSRIKIRTTPEVVFKFDASIEKGDKIAGMISKLEKERESK